MEAAFLIWIHSHSRPSLDAAFWVSHQLGRFAFCAPLVLLVAVWHLRRRERGWTWLWLLLGAGTYLIQGGLKELVERPRPDLWPRLIAESSFSFPSGHAMAAATFYPLLAWDVARHRPGRGRPAFVLAACFVLFIGFGRLYLGVHWPSDVLAGWALGLVQTAAGVGILERRARS